MRTKTLSLTSAVLLLSTSISAQLQRIVLQGSGAPQVFTDLGAAVVAAQPGDKLYLSGGTFSVTGDLVVDKPLHFIGAGIGPDSSSVTNTTAISTSGETQVLTAATGSSFTGIRFSNVMQYGDGSANYSPTGIVFQRCEFGSYANLGAGSETSIDECLFRHRLYGNDGIAVVTRCIFTFGGTATHQPISAFGTGGLTMDHCTVIQGRVSNSPGAHVSNCIFTREGSAPFWQSNGAVITNNLCVYTALVSNMTPAAESGNLLGVPVPEIFISEADQNYDWTDDIHLQPTSAGVNMAADGTDVGTYGTSSPYKPGAVPFNPHFRSATIAPATDVNGDLPVNIRVAAQTH
jgi:hypothetical protein